MLIAGTNQPRWSEETARELAEICKRIDDYELGRGKSESYPADVKRLREIGQNLNAIGGYPTMLKATRVASRIYDGAPNTVEFHWNAIGDWQS